MATRKLSALVPACVLLATWCAASCVDVRDFSGVWSGPRIGDAPALRQGFAQDATATLDIVRADLSTLQATLTTSGDELASAEIRPVPGAEADVLGDIQLSGSPSRVYLSFADTADGAGPATVFVALYPDERVEVRILRGGDAPLYGVFALAR